MRAYAEGLQTLVSAVPNKPLKPQIPSPRATFDIQPSSAMNKFILRAIWLLAAIATECEAEVLLNPTPSPSPSPSLTPNPIPTPSLSPAPVTNLTPGSLNLNPVVNKLQGRSDNNQSPPVSPLANHPQGEAPKRSPALAPQPATPKIKTAIHEKAHASSTGSSAGAGTSSSMKRSSGSFVNNINDAKIVKNTKSAVGMIGRESSFSGDKLTSSTLNKRSGLIKGFEGTAAGDAHNQQQQGSSGSAGHTTTGAVIGEVIVKGTSAPATNAAASTRTMSSQSGFITLGAVLVSAIAAFAW